MKTLRILFLFVAVALCCGGPFTSKLDASETSDKFNELVGKMASDTVLDRENDRDRILEERRNAQQDWMKLCLQTTDAKVRAEACDLMLAKLQAADTPVETAVWLIRQIGYIGGDAQVQALTELAKSDDVRIKDEAARALLWLPSAKATELRNEKQKIGVETVMPQAIPYATEADVTAWMAKYDSLDDFGKAQTLANLTKLGDKKYLPQAKAAVKSDNQALRDAGMLAIGKLGGKEEMLELLQIATGPDQKSYVANNSRDLAKDILTVMTGKGVDEALLAQLKSEKDFGKFEVLADVLSRRYAVAAKPIILIKAKSADCPNRLSLIRIAENFAQQADVGNFVDVWSRITDRGQRDQAEQIIARLVDGDSSLVLNKRTNANYAAFFTLLSRIGDEKTLEELRNRAMDKPLGAGMKASPELKAAAIRALCSWPDGRVNEDLLAIASGNKFAEGDRIAALRGFARVVSLPNDQIRIRISDEDKVKKLAQAMQLATRVDDKRLIIQRASAVRCLDSLEFVLKYFDDAELQDWVCQSILDLAHQTDLRRRDRAAFTAALDKVLAATKDNNKIRRANVYKESM